MNSMNFWMMISTNDGEKRLAGPSSAKEAKEWLQYYVEWFPGESFCIKEWRDGERT